MHIHILYFSVCYVCACVCLSVCVVCIKFVHACTYVLTCLHDNSIIKESSCKGQLTTLSVLIIQRLLLDSNIMIYIIHKWFVEFTRLVEAMKSDSPKAKEQADVVTATVISCSINC